MTENCKFAQIVGYKNSMLLYRKYGTKKLLCVNLDNLNQQRSITLRTPLTKDEFIMSFDGERYVTKRVNPKDGSKLISLFSIGPFVPNSQKQQQKPLEVKYAKDMGLDWVLPRSKKEYR